MWEDDFTGDGDLEVVADIFKTELKKFIEAVDNSTAVDGNNFKRNVVIWEDDLMAVRNIVQSLLQ